ncbi:MAG TPA: porin [Bryobacteraceae bacterium]|nr:porin [Bryobacteraceae bacterium]
MNALRSAIPFFLIPLLIVGVAFAQTATPATAPGSDSNAAQSAASSDTSSAGQQSSGAPTTDQKIQQLQNEVDQLNQKVKDMKQDADLKKVEDAASAEKTKTQASVTADTSGFTITSPHGNFLLKIGADLQMDNRTFFGTNSTNPTDLMIARRVRPTFSGTVYKYVDYFFRPDFGQGSVVIYDAYMELKYFSFAKVRAGKFKPPIGLERLQSDDDTTFVERGFPTLLVPSRDLGYQIGGDIVPSHVTYAVGVFNGVPDNSLSDTSASSHRDFAGRLFFNPLNPEIANLGFGVGASSGSVDGEALPGYKTFGQNTFFSFNSGVTEAGHRTRLAPGGYYYMGGFGLYSEYGLTEEDLQKGTVRADIPFRAWQVAGSYILTGEKKSFSGPTPKRNFDPKNHGWGAWEVAARTGDFSTNHNIFNYGFASPTATPRFAHEVVGGVNWYLNRLVRISGDYGRTNFGGGATVAQGINRPTEKIVILRLQINFI